MAKSTSFYLNYSTTPANERDIKNLEPVLNKLGIAQRIHLYADKGCACENNDNLIKDKKLKKGPEVR